MRVRRDLPRELLVDLRSGDPHELLRAVSLPEPDPAVHQREGTQQGAEHAPDCHGAHRARRPYTQYRLTTALRLQQLHVVQHALGTARHVRPELVGRDLLQPRHGVALVEELRALQVARHLRHKRQRGRGLHVEPGWGA